MFIDLKWAIFKGKTYGFTKYKGVLVQFYPLFKKCQIHQGYVRKLFFFKYLGKKGPTNANKKFPFFMELGPLHF